ncbi:MAG: MiaB/RimO family radical SAM methylthiotransferase [Thermanaerothrix sp.]|nr:MiaB/RimO family radical SAM methylthiotransferase [Thermanaerothrix sp.]
MSGLGGIGFFLVSHGCRVNQYEGDAIASELLSLGAHGAERAEDAGVLVLVSCAVTAEAERKARQEIRRLRRKNPDALLMVCGCWVNRVSDEDLLNMGVDVGLANGMKHLVPQLVERHVRGEKLDPVYRSEDAGWDSLALLMPTRHTRAFVKVQDGCSRGCTYCIIPKLRGPSRSRPLGDVLDEVRRVLDAGALEVVLTGVHLGDYRWEGFDLADLVGALGVVEGLKRLRFGSIEPFSIDERLLNALRDCGIFMRHLHVPLQSGDDRVLRRMGRGYRGDDYVALVDRAREILGDDLHVSSDVMVGFPGEDEEAFENTVRVLGRASVGRIHSFQYSPRPGTTAFDWERPALEVVRARLSRLMDFGASSLEAFASRFVGRSVTVLVERVSGGMGDGLTEEFVRVRFPYHGPSGVVVQLSPTVSRGGVLGVGDGAFVSSDDLLYPL